MELCTKGGLASDGVVKHDWTIDPVGSAYDRLTCKNCALSITVDCDTQPTNVTNLGEMNCGWRQVKLVMEA